MNLARSRPASRGRDFLLAPIAGGLALGAFASGACAQLVALPTAVVAAFALLSICFACSLHAQRSRALRLVALGFSLGISLVGQLHVSSDVVANVRALRGVPADMYLLLEQIDRSPEALLGRRIAVSGEWSPASPGGFATVSRRVMTCCAADAVRVGFDVVPEDQPSAALNTGASVCVEGVLRAAMRDGELRYIIERAHIGALCARIHKNAFMERAPSTSRRPCAVCRARLPHAREPRPSARRGGWYRRD